MTSISPVSAIDEKKVEIAQAIHASVENTAHAIIQPRLMLQHRAPVAMALAITLKPPILKYF